MAPFFIDYMRSEYESRNALCFLAPFGFLGAYFCLYMPDSTSINQNLIEEEEEEKNRGREIEMVTYSQRQPTVEQGENLR